MKNSNAYKTILFFDYSRKLAVDGDNKAFTHRKPNYVSSSCNFYSYFLLTPYKFQWNPVEACYKLKTSKFRKVAFLFKNSIFHTFLIVQSDHIWSGFWNYFRLFVVFYISFLS